MLHNQELKTTATLEKKTTAPSGELLDTRKSEPLSKAQQRGQNDAKTILLFNAATVSVGIALKSFEKIKTKIQNGIG